MALYRLVAQKNDVLYDIMEMEMDTDYEKSNTILKTFTFDRYINEFHLESVTLIL